MPNQYISREQRDSIAKEIVEKVWDKHSQVDRIIARRRVLYRGKVPVEGDGEDETGEFRAPPAID